MSVLKLNCDSDASPTTNEGELRGPPLTLPAVNAPGRPELTPAQTARVVEGMRRLLDGKFKSNAALGKALGITGSAVGQIVAAKPKNNPGRATASRVAALLGYGEDVDALLAGAPPPDDADAYPARARALARLRGLLSPEVEAQVRSVVLHAQELTELDWIRLALVQARDHADLALLASGQGGRRT